MWSQPVETTYKMADWSVEDEVSFREVFAMYDDKANGKISVAKIGEILRAFGQNPSLKDLTKQTSGFKANDVIDVEVAMAIAQKIKWNKTIKQSDVIEGLRLFDKEGKGVFSTAELKNLLTQNGEKLTAAEVDEVLASLGPNIRCEEFAKLITTLEKTA